MNAGPAFIIKLLAGVIEIVIGGILFVDHPRLVIAASVVAVIGIGTYVLELHTRLTNQGLRWRQEGYRQGLEEWQKVKS